jgi:hypothetical protein
MEAAHKLIANYMKACTALETYLHKDGALTALQVQSIDTTLQITQSCFDSWRQKNRHSN